MTKRLDFDLHFDEDGAQPLTFQGIKFIDELSNKDASIKVVYNQAIEAGLHCRFETEDIRNKCTSE